MSDLHSHTGLTCKPHVWVFISLDIQIMTNNPHCFAYKILTSQGNLHQIYYFKHFKVFYLLHTILVDWYV